MKGSFHRRNYPPPPIFVYPFKYLSFPYNPRNKYRWDTKKKKKNNKPSKNNTLVAPVGLLRDSEKKIIV